MLLFHQTNRTRKAWDAVAAQLAASGINTLTLDIRGFGESGGKAYDTLTDREIAEARESWRGDTESAWRFLVSQPGVKRDVIGAGGAGYDGVDNSVQTARQHPGDVKSLVLLSGETFLPGLRFLRRSSQLPGPFVVAEARSDSARRGAGAQAARCPRLIGAGPRYSGATPQPPGVRRHSRPFRHSRGS